MSPNKAQIRPWLSVGNTDACAEHEGPTIHVWAPASVCPRKDREGDLAIEYLDEDNLPEEILDAIAMFVTRRTGHILIHCAAGVTRSPTIAVVAIAARENRHPTEAFCDVFLANYVNRNVISNIVRRPLVDIVQWYETKWAKSEDQKAILH